MDRRAFLAGAAALAAWQPVGRIAWAEGDPGPPGFPSGIPLFRQRYENWSGEQAVDDVWTCTPATADEVVVVANWAVDAGWRVRARGAMHAWSPITLDRDASGEDHVVLVDTTALAAIEPVDGGVRVGAGALLETVLDELAERGLAIVSHPAVGEITVGGALAVGAHGAAIPAAGEVRPERGTYGSLSHATRELEAVVWDRGLRRFARRRFVRGSDEWAALSCSLGRSLLTEVVLDVPDLVPVRCLSRVDITAEELFGTGPGETMASFLEATGRVEALWFPLTERPWLKVWSVAPEQPLTSRATSGPYNYPFSDNIPDEVADLAAELVSGNPEATPVFTELVFHVAAAGLVATGSLDLWGPPHHTQLYTRSTTLRIREVGIAVLCRRADLTDVISLTAATYAGLVDEHATRGSYPVNMPFEIRASSLDDDLGRSPILSPTSPDPSRPDHDVVLYVNCLALVGTAGFGRFCHEFEHALRAALSPTSAVVRPEWSKDFAYGADGTPEGDTGLVEDLRGRFRDGRRRRDGIDGAAATLDALDPHRTFANDFLVGLLH